MNDRRMELQHILESILESRNVYFQPPESIKLSYPCIVYNEEPLDIAYANNKGYIIKNRYSLLVITKDPESDIHIKILNHFLYCSESQRYISDNLYHFAINLYY